MKKLLTFLFTCFSFLSFSQTQTYVLNGEKINADTLTREMNLRTPFTNPSGNLINYGKNEITIIIDPDNTGTIQFTVAPRFTQYPIRPAMQGFVNTEGKIVVTIFIPSSQFGTGYSLFYKANQASGNSFSVFL